MNSNSGSEWRDQFELHLDDASPVAGTAATTFVDITVAGAPVVRDAMGRTVEILSDHRAGPILFSAETRTNIISWGASGASEFILMHVAGLAVNGAALAMFKSLWAALREKKSPTVSVAREEAFQRCQMHLQSRYENHGEMRLMREEQVEGLWRFEFEDDKWVYSAAIEADGLASLQAAGRRRKG